MTDKITIEWRGLRAEGHPHTINSAPFVKFVRAGDNPDECSNEEFPPRAVLWRTSDLGNIRILAEPTVRGLHGLWGKTDAEMDAYIAENAA